MLKYNPGFRSLSKEQKNIQRLKTSDMMAQMCLETNKTSFENVITEYITKK